MKKFFWVFAALFLIGTLAFAEEEVRITTYYPAPGAVYDQLRANKLAVGNATEAPMPTIRGWAEFGKGITVNGPIMRYGGANVGPKSSFNINLGDSGTVGSTTLQNMGYATILNGVNNFATGDFAIAAGEDSTASGYSAVGIGGRAVASGNYTFAFGSESRAAGDYAFSFGQSLSGTGWTQALGDYSFAFGRAAQAIATNAIAMGYRASATDNDSMAIGPNSNAGGPGSIVIGTGTIAGGASHAMILKNGNINDGATDSVAIHLDQSTAPLLSQANTLAITGTLANPPKVGIGTVSPTSTLHVNGTATVTGMSTLTGNVGIGTTPNTNYALNIGSGPVGGYSLVADGKVYIDGQLSFSTTAGSISLSGGQLTSAGDITPFYGSPPAYDLGNNNNRWRTLYYVTLNPPASFLSFKNITKWEPFKDYLSLVPPTVQFKYKKEYLNDDREQLGYLADGLPEIAIFKETSSVDERALTAILCGAVKQLEKEVNSLKKEVSELKKESAGSKKKI